MSREKVGSDDGCCPHYLPRDRRVTLLFVLITVRVAGEERFELPSQRFGGVHNARYTIPPWYPLLESN